MAAPIKPAGNSAGSSDKRCDFLSDDFDPLTALYHLNVNEVPTPEIAPFSNLSHYSNAVQGLTAEQRRKKEASVSKPGPSTAQPSRQWERIIKPELLRASGEGDVKESISERMMIKGKKKINKDIFKGLEALSASDGPLSTLHNAMKEQRKLKVWIRSAKQLRGYSVGFIVAFDKHWNMAMVDVEETYCQPCLPRTSFTLPKQVLLQMKREQKSQISTFRPTTPTDLTSTTVQPTTAIAVESGATHKTSKPKSQELTVSKSRENVTKNDPSRSIEPTRTENRTGSETLVVPGSLRTGESSGRRPRFPRGREVKEKVPRLVGRIFVRHLNQVFVRGDNVVMIQLLS